MRARYACDETRVAPHGHLKLQDDRMTGLQEGNGRKDLNLVYFPPSFLQFCDPAILQSS